MPLEKWTICWKVSLLLALLVGANTHNVTARSPLPDSQSPGHAEQREAKLEPHPAPPTRALLGNVLLDIVLE